jgi:hypothetical protein
VNAYADNISRRNRLGIERLNGFIYENRVAKGRRSSRGQHKQPARSNYRSPKRIVAWINKMYGHGCPRLLVQESLGPMTGDLPEG